MPGFEPSPLSMDWLSWDWRSNQLSHHSSVSQNRVWLAENWMMIWRVENLKKCNAKNLNKDLVMKNHVPGWMDGWMDGRVGGSKSLFKDCFQQSTNSYDLKQILINRGFEFNMMMWCNLIWKCLCLIDAPTLGHFLTIQIYFDYLLTSLYGSDSEFQSQN